MGKMVLAKSFITDEPKFYFYKLGKASWGTKTLKYKDINGKEVAISVEPNVIHDILMRHIPDTKVITEISGIWWGDKIIMEYEDEWFDVLPVIATIKVTIGEESNPLSIIKTFHYRDQKFARDMWNSTINLTYDKDSRVLKQSENSVTIVRKMEDDVLGDPELYIDNVRYLKRVHGLHPDHNSRMEKWEINWK